MAKRPSLDIALGSPDIEAFKNKMNEASNHVGTVARQMGKRLLDSNEAIRDGLLASASTMALGVAARIAVVVGAFKLMSDAIAVTRDQLKDMVAIADKAENFGVSPQFLQSFTGEARKLKVEAGELESALSSAFNATKDKSPVDVGAWETGKDRISDVEKTLRVLNATVAGGHLEGLVLFRDADTQEQKVIAVLKAMQQLEQVGQRAAALDVGEKMFGSQFVERIRQGKTSADSMLATIQRLTVESGELFPNDLMLRAKEIDHQLKLADDRLTTALKPAFNDLAATMLGVKSTWADIVELIGKAVEVTNKLGITSETARKKDELSAVNEAIKNNTGIWGAPQIPESVTSALGMISPQERLRERRDRLQGEINAAERSGTPEGPELPKPSRGSGAAPTLKPTGDTGPDKLETATDGIAKRTAALNAEAAAINLTSGAREKAKVTAQLETIAMQANAAAGKGSNIVTEEQRQRINEVAAAYSNAAQAMTKAKIASSIKFDAQTGLLDASDVAIAQQLRDIYPNVATALGSVEAAAMRTNEAMRTAGGAISGNLASGLTDITMQTKTLGAGFRDMSLSVIRSIEEMIIKMMIVQPIMRGLQGAFGFAGGGMVTAPDNDNFIGPVLRAGGGMISGPGTGTSDSIPARLSNGEFVVNAKQTSQNRALLEAVNSGQLRGFAAGGLVSDLATPTGAMSIGGSTTTVSPTINVTVEGGSRGPQADAAMGAQLAKTVSDSVKAMIAQELRTQSRPGGVMRR